MKKIYIAGPEVFLPNAIEIGNKKKKLCEKYGFIGLFPFDNEINPEEKELKLYQIGLKIGEANEKLIQQCDYIVANITPFRSPSADVGTIFEIGYGKGLGKTIYAYTNEKGNLFERTKIFFNIDSSTDINGMSIENFDLIDNLMIDNGILSSGGIIYENEAENKFSDLKGFEECLKLINDN